MSWIKLIKADVNSYLYKEWEKFWANKNNKAKLIVKVGPTTKDFIPVPEDKVEITLYRNNVISQSMWVDKEELKSSDILNVARKNFEIPLPDETEIVYQNE